MKTYDDNYFIFQISHVQGICQSFFGGATIGVKHITSLVTLYGEFYEHVLLDVFCVYSDECNTGMEIAVQYHTRTSGALSKISGDCSTDHIRHTQMPFHWMTAGESP